jgi:glycosyltransferase involved in cell wall biosynthesis
MTTKSASFTSKSERRQCSVTAPRVSVVMGAYNGETFLRPAIESVLNQTFRDFELIVIDDCSTDSTPQILREFKDDRIRVVRNERNLGIAGTLNHGIAIARGEYVALQDHDDVSLPARLEYQVAFLDKNAQVGMVGSSCNLIDAAGNLIIHGSVEYDDVKLRWGLLWRTSFYHTTLMVRRRAIEEVGGYSSDPQYRFAEDYDLMSRVAFRYAVANIPQPLGCWRVHKTAASQLNVSQQAAAVTKISFRNVVTLWERSGEKLPPERAAYLYEGVRSFLFSRPGEAVMTPPSQIQCGLKYLRTLECAFYGANSCVPEAADHRRMQQWIWGKHAIGLSAREHWGIESRLALLFAGLRLLFCSKVL